MDAKHKVKVDRFGFTVLFEKKRTVRHLCDHACALVSVKKANGTLLADKSCCELFHFLITSQFFSFDHGSYDCGFSLSVLCREYDDP